MNDVTYIKGTEMERLEQIRKLKEIKSRITDHYEAAMHKAQQAKDQCNEAVKEALLCGQALLEAKAMVGHGKWLVWLEENCPGIVRETAWRYMKLANVAHVQHLNDAKSLRHAYQIAGILPEVETQPGEPKPVNVEAVTRWFSSLRTRISAAPILEWPEDQRQRIKEELRPLVEVYERL